LIEFGRKISNTLYDKNVKCTLVQALKLCTGRTAHRGSRGIALLFHDQWHWKGVRGQRHALAALYPWERPGVHCTGGWVGPRAGLDRCEKSRLPPGFDPRTVQPVASHYTDYATRLTTLYGDLTKFLVTVKYVGEQYKRDVSGAFL